MERSENMKKNKKTNVGRILDAKNISYQQLTYHPEQLNSHVFKTLVTKESNERNYFVFVIPLHSHLDLKRAAKAVGIKKIEMLPEKELLAVTGYVHGGCSPIGMKHSFQTIIEEQALHLPLIIVSAGKVGLQVELAPADLQMITDATFYTVVKEDE